MRKCEAIQLDAIAAIVEGDAVAPAQIQPTKSQQIRWLGRVAEAKQASDCTAAILRRQLDHAPAMRLETCDHRSMMVDPAGGVKRSHKLFVKLDHMPNASHLERIGARATNVQPSD